MKKLFALALALMTVLILPTCGAKDAVQDAVKDAVGATTAASGTTTRASGGASTAAASSGGTQEGKVSGKDMEQAVAAYLAAIGGPSAITLLGGSEIEYTPYSEWSFFGGDMWEVEDPDVSADDLTASLSAQLEPLGFTKGSSLFGPQWTIKAGAQNLGLMLQYDEDDMCTVWMTHAPEAYSASYIAEMEAQMPTIIPGENALDALPENFSITWAHAWNGKVTLARKDGSWFYGTDESESTSDPYDTKFYQAAILQSDGSYLFYRWDSDDKSVGEPRDYFLSSGNTLDEDIAEVLDFNGMNDRGSPSVWRQMSLDYQNGKQFGEANWRFVIGTGMVKMGTEVIAGVTCEVALSDSLFTKQEFAYDPATGILFRTGKANSGDELEYTYTVIEYTDSPATLGAWPG